MIEAVFISDLHLHPADQEIEARFNAFIDWARSSVKSIYILGDFFHAWAGDDGIDEWSRAIALKIKALTVAGISVKYMHGNRDFLLGKDFATLAGWDLLREPTVIQLGTEKVLLAHGDRYCTLDKKHMRFRQLTRNWIFSALFLRLSLKFRQRLVMKVRQQSQSNSPLTAEQMDVVPLTISHHLQQYQVNQLIHGHTHKPGLTMHQEHNRQFKRYVLSDWDDTPIILCYDNTKGFYFKQQ